MAVKKVADPRFFATPEDFRAWLAKNHKTETELVVGFYKTGSARKSITWPESVDEALSFGWIDGIRRSRDAESYTIRFTPRKAGSIWSAVNMKRAEVLIKARRMRAAGLTAYEARKENKVGIYAYEQRTVELPEPYKAMLKKNAAAWTFFQSQAPWYRKTSMWYIVSAKREETRMKRVQILINCSARGKPLPGLDRREKPSPG